MVFHTGTMTVLILMTDALIISALPAPQKQQFTAMNDELAPESRNLQSKEGEEAAGGSNNPFSQENMQQIGQQAAEYMIEEMKTTGKEEAIHVLHKIEDKIDRQTDKWVDDMTNQISLANTLQQSILNVMPRNKWNTRDLSHTLSNQKKMLSNINSLSEKTSTLGNLIRYPYNDYFDSKERELSGQFMEDSVSQKNIVNENDNLVDLPKDSGNQAVKPPDNLTQIPGYPSNFSNSSQLSSSQSSTLVIGGFSILLVPMPGISANNFASILQPGQQFGQFVSGNPFTNRAP